MKLTKSRDDVMVSGVLAGMGEYFKIDPTVIRIGVALLMFFSPFPVVPLYIIGAILIPDAPKKERKSSKLQDKMRKKQKKAENTRNIFEDQTSSKINDIEEDDWSDF